MKKTCSVARNLSAITSTTPPPIMARWRHELLMNDHDTLCPMQPESRGEDGDGPI